MCSPVSLLIRCRLRWVCVAWRVLSALAGATLLSAGSSPQRAFSSWGTGPGVRSGSSQALASGLIALWHAGSSQTRDQTLLPCRGRQILGPCTTRKVQAYEFNTCIDFGDQRHNQDTKDFQPPLSLPGVARLYSQLPLTLKPWHSCSVLHHCHFVF